MERPFSSIRHTLAQLSLEDQEEAAVKLSYEQLQSLRGKEEFRDLLNSKNFWTKKILHNFPETNRDELSLYDATQLQARYCYLAAQRAKRVAADIKPEDIPGYSVDKFFSKMTPGLAGLKSLSRTNATEREVKEKQAEHLRKADAFLKESKELFKYSSDNNLYRLDVTYPQVKELQKFAETSIVYAYDLQKYLYTDLIDDSADFQVQPGQLIEFWLDDEIIPEALAYIYPSVTYYMAEVAFRTPRTQRSPKIELPFQLTQRMTPRQAKENYGLTWYFNSKN